MAKWLTMLFLAAVLTVPLAGVAGAQYPYPAPPGEHERRDWEEYRHAIHEAMRGLENSKATIDRQAGPDFGGHRTKAVAHIDRALEELRMALHPEGRR